MRNVYLIAGHEVINGKGTGAHGFIDEAVEALKLRNDLVLALKSKNVKVTTDQNTSKLREVVSWLKGLVTSKDLVIDIHFNASTNPKASGVEVLIDDTSSSIEKMFSRELAEVISESLKLKNRGIKPESTTRHKRLAIISDPQVAVNVLLEICFVSNQSDVDSYKKNYLSLVNNLANVIEKYAKFVN
jgi:N-acetylmuramoyl-L-alanine amidase